MYRKMEVRGIRILHIISGGDDGGAKVHLLNLCRHSRGIFDNVVGCINGGPLFDEANALGLNTILYNQSSRFDMSVIKAIKDSIRENQIDLVNFHGANANFIYMRARKELDLPCVTTVHSDYKYDFINNKLKYLLFTPLNALAIRRFKNYICVSQRLAGVLEDRGIRGKKFVVNNGIEVTRTAERSRDEIRKEYNISEEDFVYIMVARFHPIKNHFGLIEAFNRLCQEYSDIKLMLVGTGDMENSVRKRVLELGIGDKVIFTGRQDNPLDFINACDINVLTSFNETFSLVVLEGALVKKAAISSDVGDIKEIVNSETGYIINPNSVEDIYLKMKIAFERRELLDSLGNRIHDIVTKKYNMQAFCERYYNAYKDILKGEYDG